MKLTAEDRETMISDERSVMNLAPYISRTPPPLNETEDDEDEEFGTFAVCSDLGDDVCDVFDKNSHVIKNEDNVSEDSGFCMNSVGQTQSPCDISPLSSSYNKGNEGINIDNQGEIDLNISMKEAKTCKTDSIKLTDATYIQNELIVDFESASNSQTFSSEEKMPDLSVTFQKSDLITNSNVYDNGVFSFVDHDNTSVEFIPDEAAISENTFKFVSEPSNDNSIKQLEPNESSGEKDVCSSQENTFVVTGHPEMLNGNRINEYEECQQIDISSKPAQCDLETSQEQIFSSNTITETIVERVNINTASAIGTIEDFVEWDTDDEFSDFTGFHSNSTFSETSKAVADEWEYGDPSTVYEEITGEGSEILTLQLAVESNSVWNGLRCFEETPAFKYQWSNSNIHLKFLRSLQIDSRNILCCPWNKANRLSWMDNPPLLEQKNKNSECLETKVLRKDVIPDPQFDWVSSGLINPLQGNTSEKELVCELEDTPRTFKTRSREIVDSLPKLNFVKSPCITFK